MHLYHEKIPFLCNINLAIFMDNPSLRLFEVLVCFIEDLPYLIKVLCVISH